MKTDRGLFKLTNAPHLILFGLIIILLASKVNAGKPMPTKNDILKLSNLTLKKSELLKASKYCSTSTLDRNQLYSIKQKL